MNFDADTTNLVCVCVCVECGNSNDCSNILQSSFFFIFPLFREVMKVSLSLFVFFYLFNFGKMKWISLERIYKSQMEFFQFRPFVVHWN